MQAFTSLKALVAPLNRANVDTDLIIPKQFLKSIKRTGFGVNLFDELRYFDEGYPGKPIETREVNPDFVLNFPRYKNAQILIAGENFGCGSSREHAPWALTDYGFKAIIAPSFADIFYNNSFKNGLLLIKLDTKIVEDLMQEVETKEGYELKIDLQSQKVIKENGEEIEFEIDPFRKHCMLNGLDDIGLTLEDADLIRDYESKQAKITPWIFN